MWSGHSAPPGCPPRNQSYVDPRPPEDVARFLAAKHRVQADWPGGQDVMLAKQMQLRWTVQRFRTEKPEQLLAMVGQIAIQFPR